MKNAYSFDGVADEVRAKHRPDFVESALLHPPLPDESTCSDVVDAPAEKPVEYPRGEWVVGLVVIAAVVCVSYLIDHPISLP